MYWLTHPFTQNPEKDLNNLKGTTWSGNFFGLKLSDPLGVAGQIAAAKTVYWPYVLTALIPIVLTLVFGRFFCGWICPATFIYELNDGLAGIAEALFGQYVAMYYKEGFLFGVMIISLLIKPEGLFTRR